MKRASYRDAVAWIAAMDSPGDDLTEQECGELVTACLVADTFDVPTEKVARDVFRARERNEKAKQKERRSRSS